jgi:predicted TPR repeat methyltransferase
MCGFCLPYIAKQDTENLIENATKLLKKDGIIYLSTIEGEYSKSPLETSSGGEQMYTYDHNAAHLSEQLEANGFTLLDINQKAISGQQDLSINDLFIIAIGK